MRLSICRLIGRADVGLEYQYFANGRLRNTTRNTKKTSYDLWPQLFWRSVVHARAKCLQRTSCVGFQVDVTIRQKTRSDGNVFWAVFEAYGFRVNATRELDVAGGAELFSNAFSLRCFLV